MLILAWLSLSAGLLAAQASLSPGPPLLHHVRTIYVAPSSDDFALLVKARLEKWDAVRTTSRPEEADAILICQTQSTIVPAKVVIRRTTPEVTLVDPRSQKPIWTTTISSFDTSRLADAIIEQLKRTGENPASEY